MRHYGTLVPKHLPCGKLLRGVRIVGCLRVVRCRHVFGGLGYELFRMLDGLLPIHDRSNFVFKLRCGHFVRDDRTLGIFNLPGWKLLCSSRSFGGHKPVRFRIILLTIGNGVFGLRCWHIPVFHSPVFVFEL